MRPGGPLRCGVKFQCVNKFHLSRSLVFPFIAIIILSTDFILSNQTIDPYHLGTNAQGFCDNDGQDCSPNENENNWIEQPKSEDADPNLEAYKNYFDENGKFKADMFNHDLPKDDYEVEESTLEEEDKSENVEYNHMRTPNYTIVLSSSYEDNIVGENQFCVGIS